MISLWIFSDAKHPAAGRVWHSPSHAFRVLRGVRVYILGAVPYSRVRTRFSFSSMALLSNSFPDFQNGIAKDSACGLPNPLAAEMLIIERGL